MIERPAARAHSSATDADTPGRPHTARARYARASPIPTEAPLAPAYWDALTWDTFTWDGRNLNPVNAGIDSSGENIALRVASASAMYDAFTINSLIVTYSPRRGLR